MAQVLRHLPDVSDPHVLVAALTRDDAAVYRLTADRAIVATVDFFTPIVDDAYVFGAIAAANAFSDLYAMGATPLLALNIVGWPREPDMLDLLGETVRGAVDIATRAGAFILGGHSIDDREPKFGLVAIGEVDPARLITNAGAKPGDRLVLTKAIGTGILSTGLKQQRISEKDMDAAIRSMMTLNAGAMRAMQELGDAVHAATDVTGFGLLGHLRNLLVASNVGARLVASTVPIFPHARALVTKGVVPGGTSRNLEAAREYTQWPPEVDETTQTLLCDAQTSGGLLIAVEAAHADELVAALEAEDTPVAAAVGWVVEGRGDIEVTDEP